MVEKFGNTVKLAIENPPGSQVYVMAPVTNRFTPVPAHIWLGLALALSNGSGFTTRATVLVLEQAPLVLKSVYVVGAGGETVTEAAVRFMPGVHV